LLCISHNKNISSAIENFVLQNGILMNMQKLNIDQDILLSLNLSQEAEHSFALS